MLGAHAQTVTATVGVGDGPGWIAVNPVTHKICVANGNTNNVTVIDGATWRVHRAILVQNSALSAIRVVLHSSYSDSQRRRTKRRDFSSNRVERRLRMRGLSYRMKTSTLAIRVHDGQRLPTSIPAGGEIEVLAGPAEGDRLLHVLWEGNAVMKFSTDVREHGEPLRRGCKLNAP